MKHRQRGIRAIHQIMMAPRPFFAWRHYYVYPTLGIGYTYIPKNASSRIKTQLGQANGSMTRYVGSHSAAYRPVLAGIARQSAVTFRFVVLRDPVERLVSYFLEKYVVGEDWMAPQVSLGLRPRSLLVTSKAVRACTFRDVVEYLTLAKRPLLNDHLRPQADFLLGGAYDHVGTVEDLGVTLALLEKRGVPAVSSRNAWGLHRMDVGEQMADVPVERLRRLWYEDGILPSTANLVSDDVLRRLRSVYETDYALYAGFAR